MRSNEEIHILVVDDKKGSREALQKMIAKEGITEEPTTFAT